MDITFVIVSYNQEKRIIECLESVKYQILNYLQGRDVQLIVADDGSKDNTAYNIQRWVEENGRLFAQVNLILSEKNMGTCKNVGSAYRNILSERFVSLAADDLISDVDVLTILNKYSKEKVVSCVPYVFTETKIIEERERYFSAVIPYFYTQQQIREVSRRDAVIVNGGFYSSTLLNEDILEFMEKFQLLDDQARYFYMLENNKNIKYDVCYEPILMYRVSNEQVTNRKGEYWKRLIDDKKKLVTYTIKKEPKIKNKISILLSLLAMIHPELYGLLLKFDVSIYHNKRIAVEKKEEINQIIDLLLRKDIIIQKEKYIKYLYEKSFEFFV